MEIFMKDHGVINNLTIMANFLRQMVTFMKEIGETAKNLDTEYRNQLMAIYMKDMDK